MVGSRQMLPEYLLLFPYLLQAIIVNLFSSILLIPLMPNFIRSTLAQETQPTHWLGQQQDSGFGAPPVFPFAFIKPMYRSLWLKMPRKNSLICLPCRPNTWTLGLCLVNLEPLSCHLTSHMTVESTSCQTECNLGVGSTLFFGWRHYGDVHSRLLVCRHYSPFFFTDRSRFVFCWEEGWLLLSMSRMYWGLNAITQKDLYPLLLLSTAFDLLYLFEIGPL